MWLVVLFPAVFLLLGFSLAGTVSENFRWEIHPCVVPMSGPTWTSYGFENCISSKKLAYVNIVFFTLYGKKRNFV